MMKTQKKNTNKIYGELTPYDPTFSGPVHKRSFTDVLCCFIFVATMAGYVIISGAAWLYGNPQYIIKEQKYARAFCGVGPNVDKPNLFYFDMQKCASAVNISATTFSLQCPTTQVCIKKCPSAFWFLPPEALVAGAKPSDFFQQEFCVPTLDLAQTTFTVQDILDKGLCPAYYTPSTPVLRKCLPSFDPKDVPPAFTVHGSTLNNKTIKVIMDISSSIRSGFITVRIIEDLAISWYWILIGLGIALAVSMVLLLLMRCCVSVVVVVTSAGLLSLGAYGIYQCYQQYKKHMNSQIKFGDLSLQSEVSDYLKVKEIWLACLVIVSLLEFILVMVFISCLRKGLPAALAMMREVSKNLMTSGLPVYKTVGVNVSNAECTAITGVKKCFPETFKASDYPNCIVRCAFVHYDEEEGFFQRHAQNLQIYNLLACLWCLYFFITLGQCIIARTFSSYYWSLSKPHNIRRSILYTAFCQTLRYHTGSMAFGTIFVNMFQGVRIVLEYLKDKTEGGRICCCSCFPLNMLLKGCFYVLDKVLKYFTRNTYIMITTYGDNFFISANNVYMLCGRNKGRVLKVDWITDLLLFFGRLLVVGAMGVLAFYFFNGDIPVTADIFQAKSLNFSWLPVILVMVGTYFIAQGCFSVYSMGVDTFTLCVMDDLERNDGTLQRPYMSRTLMQLLQRQNDVTL
ncbi:choline transporter-like protein 4 isoform X2 [Tachysurus fulvidraco]|uniref:choline transporter-like protein 4 isoform X2 n=1 Tax=Tachysurus fulvidraco TaxID=1234273 RepID=UPI001FF0158E|nr:choline transporter-like protein 4 isoform X2 [Tachysurus fulvidraco]